MKSNEHYIKTINQTSQKKTNNTSPRDDKTTKKKPISMWKTIIL